MLVYIRIIYRLRLFEICMPTDKTVYSCSLLYLNYASNTTILCSKRIRKLRPLNTIYYSRWYQIYIYRQTPLRFDSTVTKTFCNPPLACKHTFKLAFVFCHRPSRENIRSNQLSQVLYPRASHYIKRSLFISCLGR